MGAALCGCCDPEARSWKPTDADALLQRRPSEVRNTRAMSATQLSAASSARGGGALSPYTAAQRAVNARSARRSTDMTPAGDLSPTQRSRTTSAPRIAAAVVGVGAGAGAGAGAGPGGRLAGALRADGLEGEAARSKSIAIAEAAEKGHAVSIRSRSALRASLRGAGTKLVVVRFGAPWCAPCNRLTPVFHRQAGKYADQAMFLLVDVDDSPDIADQFNVSNVLPTVVFVRRLREVHRLEGGDVEAFRDAVAQCVAAAAIASR